MSLTLNMVGGGGGTPRKYLVKNGIAVAGNLVAIAMKSSSTSAISPGSPGIVQSAGQSTLGWTTTSSTNGAGIVYVNQTVDLSKYSLLYLHGTWNTYATSSFAQVNLSYNLWTSIGQYQNENRLIQVAASGLTAPNGGDFNSAARLDTRSILVFDLSTLASRPSAYVGFNFAHANVGYTNVKLYDIWLE